MLTDIAKKIGFKEILILSILVLGFYLCFVGGYGSDEDTLPMIYVFEARLADGRFVTSRFTGYPIPEIGIGFLAYFLGSWASNLATYLFFLIGVVLFYFSFSKKIDYENFKYYIILCLSSPVLFFDNLESIDYSWAFLFFSIGTFFLSRKIFELAILAFAFAVGSRMNFLIFCILVIFFFNYENKISVKKKTILAFCTFIIGGLFYLPIWFDNGFGLNWITAARPLEQGFFGLIARFSYKTLLSIGLLQSIFIIYFLKRSLFSKKVYSSYKIFFILIASNLLLFLYIPAELSYLQPALIILYFVLSQQTSRKLILILIFLNFSNWFINFDILKIQYKDSSRCGAKHAISANLDLSIKIGSLDKFFSTRDMMNCWADDSLERGKRILEGKSTKIKD